MTGIIRPKSEVVFVVLRVETRFPLPEGAGQEAVRRLWSHDSVRFAECLVEGPTLHDVVEKIKALP